MSHGKTPAGRLYVECDHIGIDPARRCGRRSFGTRDSAAWEKAKVQLRGAGSSGAEPRTELGLFDLPRGWSVAPHPDDFDHGVTRTSLLDGRPILPSNHLVGISGDLHTCPSCDRMRHVA